MGEAGTSGKNAYATLLTRPSYLAGAILLAFSLNRHSPTTPLIIFYTPETLSESSINALKAESRHTNTILHAVEHLRLPGDGKDHGMVAERFIDTWTKLRVFDLHTLPQNFENICFLDADMMILRDPTPFIFTAENDEYLRSGDRMKLMATHTCVCNLEHDSWAPKTWNPDNCALTYCKHADDIPEVKEEPDTMAIFNSGTFVFRGTSEIADFVHKKFEEFGPEKLKKMKFPDQDFLNEVFMGKWKSLSWRTNALKTWRYWHPNVWTADSEPAVLHYIVDKPWAKRVEKNEDAKDGLRAGYLGNDGVTHSWWWNEFANWSEERKAQGEDDLLATVAKHSASGTGEDSEEMRAIGGGAQDFAKKWKDGEEKKSGDANENTGDEKKEDSQQEGYGQGPHGPILRKPMLGERGHGPVARGRGLGGMKRGGGWSYMEP